MYEQIKEHWEEILLLIKEELGLSNISYTTWLTPLSILDYENDTAIIGGNLSSYNVEYLKKKYLLPMKVAIAEITGIHCEIQFLLDEDDEKSAEEHRVLQAMTRAGLNMRYTFDTFVVGSNNKFAHAASLAVAESPGQIYNPLFIYGGVGLGKTHLMHSIAHFIIQNNPELNVLYVTSEDFTNEVINAIRIGNPAVLTEFREKYRNIDVLLIDDIQFIIGKESTQEEFFHTFNTLHASHRQIIVSSDRPPRDFDILEERNRSRFEWGLMADIQSPDFETRMAILRKKQEQDGYIISDEVLAYIANNITSNIRELEGSLNKVMAKAALEKREVDVALAKMALLDMIAPGEKVLTPQYIIDVVADHYNLTVDEIKSINRSKKIAYPRQIAMYLLRKYLSLNYEEIGAMFGGKNHSTVMHGCEKIEMDMTANEELRATLELLRKKINPA